MAARTILAAELLRAASMVNDALVTTSEAPALMTIEDRVRLQALRNMLERASGRVRDGFLPAFTEKPEEARA